jgi:hypothetical protein
MISYSARKFIFSTAFVVFAVVTASSAGAAGAFDGSWTAVIVTRSGTCNLSFRVGGHITNGIMHYGGGANNAFSGRVAPSGAVVGTFSVGPIHAAGSGRFSSHSGSGTWRGQGANGPCSGTWTAQRS